MSSQRDEAPHLVKSFSQELARLRDLLAEMGGIVESQLALATQAVVEQDAELAARAVQQDPQVDQLERQVEQLVIRMLALRQPMASDLRQIVGGLKISAGLERIGDYAKNVAKRSIVLNQFALPFSLSGLAAMARLAQESLRLIIDAIGENDPDKAVQVWQSDQGIDDLYNSIFRELITYMMEDPRSITPCAHLLFIAKNLERIGDHATNIAETVYYTATGTPLTEDRPRGGDGSVYATGTPLPKERPPEVAG
jgi:phosphate transport system protein